ncbi:IS1182 family transposase [Carboxylicivirga marina]|uniref:IS1182 family transposase n=1 Tax=Carboxylicivirga marina TaxID=2800988 RepID=A0ABS1HHQ8_9BACT|nr:IS1182 family transposase [Carboxylicivirga marina]MBK3516808.1 IS1182 family transposase [Carboxylicivirga marina]
MVHQQGEDRNQMFMFSLEGAIAPDAFVRVVDAFVDAIDLKSFGFNHVECKEEGRPPYHPGALMKLYLYGYRYGIRTSRRLEREAQTNIEAMWLLSGLRPKYKTIADFRKNHPKAFREVFRRFVCLLKEWKLIDGETIAIDSFKIRGDNSLKNNFNEKKLKQHIEYIDNKIAEYEVQLEQAEKAEEKEALTSKIKERQDKKVKYEQIKNQLDERGEDQISTTDPDAKSVVFQRNSVRVGYNIQASSGAKHKLMVEFGTGDVNDTHALAPMAIASKELLQVEELSVLADKGYHTGEQLHQCHTHNITSFVSPKEPSTKDTGLYPISAFIYNTEHDYYTCPCGSKMLSNGKWHKRSENRRRKKSDTLFKRYTTKDCKTCDSRQLCTQSKVNGRNIDRSQYAYDVELNNQRVNNNPEYYRQRQQITEHMFGTFKRQWGFTHTLLRGKEKVLGEVGLLFISYNLSRSINIIGAKKLIDMLKKHASKLNYQVRAILSLFEALKFQSLEVQLS